MTIGRDRGYLFYPGQPRFWHKCGSGRHLESNCTKLLCSKCGLSGRLAKDCKNEVKCNLCNQTGHLYINCPKSEKNGLPEGLWFGLSVEEQMDVAAEELEETANAESSLASEGKDRGMPTSVVGEEEREQDKTEEENQKVKEGFGNPVIINEMAPPIVERSSRMESGGTEDVAASGGSDVREEETVAVGTVSGRLESGERRNAAEFSDSMKGNGESAMGECSKAAIEDT
nr:PREDICTED: uncharacterized protein LOC106702362 [Latimeria chalumnae]|eukprot:XP_014340000.1 PREDICTED: uncharacterized protein LOC106702362 [Latimeria chalumnae]